MNAYEKYLTLEIGRPRDDYYEASTQLMDMQLRKELKSFMKITTDGELLDAYCVMHEADKGVIFEGANLP